MQSVSRYFQVALAGSAALLAACSGGSSTSGAVPSGAAASIAAPRLNVPQRAHVASWMHKLGAQEKLAYVADAGGILDIFDQKSGALEGQITGYGQLAGVYVDKNHNVWITAVNNGEVVEFARGSTVASRTLSDPSGDPYDVTVCSNGTVYVSNLAAGSVDDAVRGNIVSYPKGSNTPKNALQFPDQLYNQFLDCDKAGNIFTTLFYGASQSAVVEYVKGKGQGTMLPISVVYVGGVKTEKNGDILVGDQAGTITEYTEAGVATGRSITTGTSGNDIQQFAMTKNGATAGGADSRGKQGLSWKFPSNTPGVTYGDPNFAYPTGFAYDPPAPR